MAEEQPDDQNEDSASKDRQRAQQDSALDSVTDLVQEKELDESKVKRAMMALAEAQKTDKEAQRKRDKELASVKVSKENIDTVASEFEVDRKLAEKRLRECKGSLKDTLKSFLL